MHYAEKLNNEVRAYHGAVVNIHSEITDLMAYLRSPKFQYDPMVNTADVLMRLEEIRNNLLENTP